MNEIYWGLNEYSHVNRNVMIFSLLIILISLFLAFLKNKSRINNFIINRRRKAIGIYGVLIVGCVFVLFVNTKMCLLKRLYFINIVLVAICTICAEIEAKYENLNVEVCAEKETKKENLNAAVYFIATILFIECVSFSCYINESSIKRFVKSNDKSKLQYLFLFVIVILVFAFMEWYIVYLGAKKIKEINELELKVLVIKSILQSLTAAIAIFGLSNSGLPNSVVLYTLIIDVLATFSYPILDIIQYICKKEIEQSNDRKSKTVIYFLK